MLALAEHDILHRGLLQLRSFFRELPVEIVEHASTQQDHRIDGLISVVGEQYPYEVVGRLTVGQLRRRVSQLREYLTDFILVLEYADEKIRSYCRDHQINFIDGAGNAYLNLPGLKIVSAPQADPLPVHKGSGNRMFQGAGLQLVYAFTRVPGLIDASVRRMQQATDLSLGSISGILDDMQKNEFLSVVDSKRQLLNGRKLVMKWAYAYLETIRPTLFRGYFLPVNQHVVERLAAQTIGPYYLSGELAADRRGGHLAADHYTLYTDLIIPDLAKIGLVPLAQRDREGSMEVLQLLPVDRQLFTVTASDDPLIGDLILYADLIESDEPRVLDAAERLLNYEIQDRFTANGFRW